MKRATTKTIALVALGAMSLVTCSGGSGALLGSERRAAIVERQETARGYAEFLRARYASLTNDPHQAAVFYGRSVLTNPDDPDLLERAVFSALIAGDVDAAVKSARSGNAEAINKAALPKLVLGVDALKQDHPARAARYFQSDTANPFNDVIYGTLAAWAILDTDGETAAFKALDNAQSGDALLDGLSLAARGFMQLHLEDDTAALDTFSQMWSSGVRLASTTEYLARLLEAKGEHDQAINVLTAFGNRIGQNAAIETLRTQLIAGEAITLERPSIKEGAALAIYAPAAALAAQSESDLPGVYFALALELNPDLHVARTLWGDALDNADRREDAIAILASVPESSPFYATSRGQIAWAYRRDGANDQALATAREALGATPDRNLKIQLGDLFRSLGQLEDADRIFSELIEADLYEGREDWRLFYARGAAREKLDRWDEAEADLVNALALAPDQPALLNYLGYSWIDRGENLEEGFAMIKRAVELRPDAGFIIDSLGWAYYRLGDYEEAVMHLERAVELSPSEPTLNEHLGDAYWRVGRLREAGFQWQRAIKLAPESDEVPLLKAKLEEGLDAATALVTAQSETAKTP